MKNTHTLMCFVLLCLCGPLQADEGEAADPDLPLVCKCEKVVVHAMNRPSLHFSLGFSHQASNDIRDTLLGEGYTQTYSYNKRDRDGGWKMSFRQPLMHSFGVELGYVDLGSSDTYVSTQYPKPYTPGMGGENIVSKVTSRGHGAFLGGYIDKPIAPKTHVRLGFGVYDWRDDQDIHVNKSTFARDTSGVDRYVSVGLEYDIDAETNVSFEFERYFLDSKTDRFGLGMGYRF